MSKEESRGKRKAEEIRMACRARRCCPFPSPRLGPHRGLSSPMGMWEQCGVLPLALLLWPAPASHTLRQTWRSQAKASTKQFIQISATFGSLPEF